MDDLKKINELSKSIKRKYMSLRRGAAETELALQKTFQPILTPLETLVEQSKKPFIPTSKKLKVEVPIKPELPTFLKSEVITESTPVPSSEEAVEEALLDPTSHEEAASYLEQYGPLSRKYVVLFASNDKDIDKNTHYSLKYINNQLTIGNSVVTFDKDDIIIGGNEYEGTPGLYELLFMKDPEKFQITDADHENYLKILSDSKTIYRH